MRLFIGLVLIGMVQLCEAKAPLNETLVRVINQLNNILPLLDEAEKAIDPTARIKLHIRAFEGADGEIHNGVRDDILSIRNSLIDYINQPPIAPQNIKPLAFDFVSTK